jgi:hypothetical protein
MKRAIVLVLAATWSWVGAVDAGVNCDQVKKYLKTGRTPQDVSDTMVVPIDEVKKCQGESGAAAPAPGAAGTPSGGKAGASAAPEGSKAH